MTIDITLHTTVAYAYLNLDLLDNPRDVYLKMITFYNQGKIINLVKQNNSTLHIVAPDKETMCEVLNATFTNLRITHSEQQ